jgi:hypothetical protein
MSFLFWFFACAGALSLYLCVSLAVYGFLELLGHCDENADLAMLWPATVLYIAALFCAALYNTVLHRLSQHIAATSSHKQRRQAA